MLEAPKGGAFLLEDVGDREIFIPESLTDEQRQLAQVQYDFSVNDVLPKAAQIEKQEFQVTKDLMKKAGDLGLLMADVPELDGGLGIDSRTMVAVGDNTIIQSSFGVTLMAHTGIGTWPLVYYGTKAQKEKYLGKLITGEWIGAYALTEPNSGSDAMSLRTKATLSKDGKYYLLSGEKIYITNGGIASLYTVYAKVDGDDKKIAAFLVERNTEGLSVGPEEKKMGLWGSSTVPLHFDNVKVPVENLLGEIGRGHKIAFNILNLGRFKLGIGATGSCKRVLGNAVRYTKERKQFGKYLHEFGMIQHKLSNMVIGIYASETMNYRTAGYIDERWSAIDKASPDYYRGKLKIIEEFAVETSMAKVYSSELLDLCTDQGIQILGGYGYLRDYPMEQADRDQRVNRIYEGTNEINRLLIPGTLFKRAMKGELDLMGGIQKVVNSLKDGFPKTAKGPLSDQIHQANLAKKLTLYCAGLAAQKYADQMKEKQFCLEALANLAMEAYAIDSVVCHTLQILKQFGEERGKVAIAIGKTYCAEKYPLLLKWAYQMLANVAEANPEEFGPYAKALKRFEYLVPIDTVAAHRLIVASLLEKDSYSVV